MHARRMPSRCMLPVCTTALFSCVTYCWAISFEVDQSPCMALHNGLPTCCGAQMSGPCNWLEGAGQCPAVMAAMQSPGQVLLILTATVPNTCFQHHLHDVCCYSNRIKNIT